MEAHTAAIPTPAGAKGNPDAYRLFGGFRLLLALMVVVSHTHRLAGEAFSGWIGKFGLGNMAVMTFFVLSGFVIAEANELFYNRRTGAFLINRLLRIFPPYLVALAFSILLHLGVSLIKPLEFYDIIPHEELMFSWRNILRNIFALCYIYSATWFNLDASYAFVRYYWAVAVELHLYYGAAFIYFVRSLLERLVNSGSMLMRLYLPWCFVVFVAGFCLAHFRQNAVYWYFLFGSYFALGMSVYYWRRPGGNKMLCAIAIVVGWAFANLHFFSYQIRNPASPVLPCVIIFNVLLVAFFLLSGMTASGKWRIFDRKAGDLSYPVYLNHYAVSIVFLSLFGQHRDPVLVFAGGIVASLAISRLANAITDPLTRSLRNRLRGTALG